MNRDALKSQLKIDEGFRAKPYIDTEGFVTIGYGHKGLEDVFLDNDGSVCEEYALSVLEKDVNAHVRDLNILLPWWVNLDDARQDVLANMAFNLGIHRLLGFKKMLTALQAQDFDKAAEEMLDSKWAIQVKGRADRLAATMRTGVDNAGEPTNIS